MADIITSQRSTWYHVHWTKISSLHLDSNENYLNLKRNKLGIAAYSVFVLYLHSSTKASYLIGGQEFYLTSAELCLVRKSERIIRAMIEASSCSFKRSCSSLCVLTTLYSLQICTYIHFTRTKFIL
jgi:hypothetical protein